MTMKWTRNEDWVGSMIDDNFVMLHIESGMYIALNATAAAIWDALGEVREEDQIVAMLLEQFEVEEDHCRAKVSEILGEMREKELVAAL